MKVILIAVVITLAAPLLADDKPGTDPEFAARVAEAQARLKAKSIAATQAASSDDPVVLRSIILEQKREIESLKAQVVMLTRQIAAAKPNAPSSVKATEPELPADEKVVLTPIQFRALPKGTATGKPLGFTEVSLNSVGYVVAAAVIRVIDESNAIVEILLERKDGTIDGGDVARGSIVRQGSVGAQRFIIDGMSTAGLTDAGENNGWSLNSWFKIIGTRKYDGATYFVARQIVQEDRTHPIRKPAK